MYRINYLFLVGGKEKEKEEKEEEKELTFFCHKIFCIESISMNFGI
jgi:hypothetical protein